MACNLRWLEGGQALFNDTLEKYEYVGYDLQEKQLIMQYAKKRGYLPMKLEKFSPYKEDYAWNTLYEAAKPPPVKRLQAYEGIALAEARKQLQNIFNLAANDFSHNIHVIRGATGIGKTECYSTLESKSGVLIAFPDHDLKDDTKLIGF